MQKIKIITDSCSDLPAEIVKKYNISLLNIPVNIENQVYYDRLDLMPADFYKILSTKNVLPKTSRVTPKKFKETYQKYLDSYDHILVFAFSSKLSGILESAVMAKQELATDRVTVIDTKAASVGQGLLVCQAAQMLEKEIELEKVITKTINSASHLEHVFAVGDLEMLKKGGRISKAQAFMAGVLNIKPILHIIDGEILPYDKVRGKRKMFSYLINEIEKKADNPAEQTLAITYSQIKEDAINLKHELEKRFAPQNILMSEIGSAIGSHAGPGTLAVVYQNSEKIADAVVY
ncbi:DegV family protein [Halanaerobium salsuginis]|jgi:DegV family protein with EDD domain|uniref:EDD domain protein, DegV family n=1 Tax=Halanaerobium salsuginis TaxID=29563 RepID=A0A1I4HQ18_9FIRM|nr:DegV family protein [Halanaerobium salsuginis]SFL44398.1 EDD domain protein, DegV family [Halanaerobium salsuginis]